MEKLMKNDTRRMLWTGCAAAGIWALTALAQLQPVRAQEAPEPLPESTPLPETQAPTPTQPIEEDDDAPAPPPPPPDEVKEDPTKKPVTVNAWGRVAFKLQSFDDPSELDRLSLDGEFELHTDGAITEHIGITANLAATFGPDPAAMDGGTIAGTASLMDLIGRFDIDDAFHVWVGRMLVPSDRANFSGVWFAAPWYYPGLNGSGPRQGPRGRNDGVGVWGQFAGGMLKYYVSAFDLYSATKQPLWSGRINVSLLSPEPGYYHSSTYYGSKDILAIAVGGQLQNDASVDPMGTEGPDDYMLFNADILFEKTLGGAGTIGVEGAFYKYEGDFEVLDYSYLALVSYLTPEKIGIGKLQPLVRFQEAKPQVGDSTTSFEGQLGYVVADYSARFALGYRYTKTGDADTNALYLGAQMLK
jgi:hypothetical protein